MWAVVRLHSGVHIQVRQGPRSGGALSAPRIHVLVRLSSGGSGRGQAVELEQGVQLSGCRR